MKKQILLLITAFGVNAVQAQITDTLRTYDQLANQAQSTGVIPNVDAPLVVVNKFNTNYPGIDETWQMDGDNYVATYKDKGTNMGRSISYDKNANIVCTDSELDKASYPQKIRDYYTKNYPNESYKIWACRDSKGNRTYYSKHNLSTIWFDKKGDYVATKPDKSAQKTTPKK